MVKKSTALKKSRTRSQIGRGSRQKGAQFERQVGKLFREWAKPALKDGEDPEDWFCRTPSSGGRSWSKKHAQGEDLMVPAWFPYDIECRKRETWSWSALLSGDTGAGQILNFYFEAQRKAKGRPVMLVFSKNHESIWVLMPQFGGAGTKGHCLRTWNPIIGTDAALYLGKLTNLLSLLYSSVIRGVFETPEKRSEVHQGQQGQDLRT